MFKYLLKSRCKVATYKQHIPTYKKQHISTFSVVCTLTRPCTRISSLGTNQKCCIYVWTLSKSYFKPASSPRLKNSVNFVTLSKYHYRYFPFIFLCCKAYLGPLTGAIKCKLYLLHLGYMFICLLSVLDDKININNCVCSVQSRSQGVVSLA